MIWSFLKITAFVALVAGAALLANYFATSGGGIRIELPGQEFFFGPVQAVIALILALVGLWLVLRLLGLALAVLRFVNGDETAFSRYFDRNRERKGYQALTDGMMALASGDGAQAMAQAARAERLLRQPQLTNLLSAQAAEMSGDARKAGEVYRRLLTDERTRFVGVRGLMKQKLAEGDRETALKLAEKAFLMRPSNRDIQDTLFDLQAGAGDWAGARKVLGASLKHGHLPRDVHRRRDAILVGDQHPDGTLQPALSRLRTGRAFLQEGRALRLENRIHPGQVRRGHVNFLHVRNVRNTSDGSLRPGRCDRCNETGDPGPEPESQMGRTAVGQCSSFIIGPRYSSSSPMMTFRIAGLPSRLAWSARSRASRIPDGSVTRSPYPPTSRAMSA